MKWPNAFQDGIKKFHIQPGIPIYQKGWTKRIQVIVKFLRFTNKCNKPKHRQKSNKWFGRECHEMRSKLKQECHALNRNSDNPQLRGQYFQCKGMYKSIYRNRRENLNRILSQILKICIIQRANFWRDLLKQFHKKKENRVEKENLPSIQSLSKHYQNLL